MALDLRGMCPLIQVFDMPISLAFYCDLLGFAVVTSSAPVPNCDWAWLKLRGMELMLNTAYERDQRPPAPDAKRIAAHDDTCLYFGVPDVDAVYAYLRDKGAAAKKPTIASYGMKQLYLHDPDGYNLCFQCAATEEERKSAKAQASK